MGVIYRKSKLTKQIVCKTLLMFNGECMCICGVLVFLESPSQVNSEFLSMFPPHVKGRCTFQTNMPVCISPNWQFLLEITAVPFSLFPAPSLSAYPGHAHCSSLKKKIFYTPLHSHLQQVSIPLCPAMLPSL